MLAAPDNDPEPDYYLFRVQRVDFKDTQFADIDSNFELKKETHRILTDQFFDGTQDRFEHIREVHSYKDFDSSLPATFGNIVDPVGFASSA